MISDDKEQRAQINALVDWLEDQGINFQDSAFICATVAGGALGVVACNEDLLESGIKILQNVLAGNAKRLFEKKEKL